MKKEYKKPKATFVDYSYQEQVVATSPGENFSGIGDGNFMEFCTWLSGSTANPCTDKVGGGDPRCQSQEFSLRRNNG